MLDLGLKITAAGEQLPDIHITYALVLSLPAMQSWDIVTIQLFRLEASKLPSSTVSATLICEANHHAKEKSSETALLAKKLDTHGKAAGGKKGSSKK
jgi:hypothetical protein